MKPSEQLDITQAAFAQWQQQGNRYHYPRNLKNDALNLLRHYPASKLSKALGVTTKCLHNWLNASPPTQPEPLPDFIPLTIEATDTTTSSEPIQLVLQLPHNLSLTLPNQPAAHTAKFICALVKELSTCSI